MTTHAERAELAEVDRWIQSWNNKQILAYDKQVATREKQYRRDEERPRGKDDGFVRSDDLKEVDAQYNWGEHIRRRLPVGAFLDSIKEDRDGDSRPSCAQLMEVARTGKELFYAAVGHSTLRRSSWTRPAASLARSSWPRWRSCTSLSAATR